MAGNIVNPPFDGLGQKAQALIFEGTAKELGIMASTKAFNTYLKRWPNATSHVTDKALRQNLTQVRFYKITPKLFMVFDEVNFPDDPRQEYVPAK